MAISPPSDLVLDVVKAADINELQAAREKLRATGAANEAAVLTASNAGFESAISSMDKADTGSRSARIISKTNDEKIPDTYRKFEASILSTFIQNMMPSESEAVYGKGSAGEFWKSMMAEQIADAVSKRGGIGIAEQVYSQSVERARGAVPNASTDENDRNMAINMITDFQRRTLISSDTDNKTT